MGQSEGNDSAEIRMKPGVRQFRNRAGPAGGIEIIAITDQAAGSADQSLGVVHLRLGGLAVELDQQDADRHTRDKR